VLRIAGLILVLVMEVAMGVIRLIAVLADVLVPFLGPMNALYFQDSGPLLQISHPLRAYYVVWSSAFSLAALVLGLRLADRPAGQSSRERWTKVAALAVLLFALLVAVAYPGVLAGYDSFLRTSTALGTAWFWRNFGWSLALILTYSTTFSLLSFGMTLLAAIAYRHATESIELLCKSSD
jgi:hypothetical protein